ncbi:hypothetical protein [Acinetobacter sp. YH12098]|uniref:hypothetical protein n=1 Tax=Acinetobacter sp. YH12098 TaxID=2601087 RepID=UPI0015D23B92|nr:hypothetical protein [Acinetobacter sp. YH12098]
MDLISSLKIDYGYSQISYWFKHSELFFRKTTKGTLKIISRLERKSERYVEAQNYANDIQAAS